MRLDKFLKVSRIIKRRTIANEACSLGRVSVNGKAAKPSHEVKEGDELTIAFGNRVLRARVDSTQPHAQKADARGMYSILEGNEHDC